MLFHRLTTADGAARNRRRGLIGIVVIVAALATTGVAYLNPTGTVSYTAQLTNSSGLRPGDEIRIAGIPVGKVTKVRLARTVVEMTFDVDRGVPVGADSTIEIKLLTPLGGHYVALDPQGEIPLGTNMIPTQNTAIPFEINDILQTATPVVEQVDGQVIHDTFEQIANAANKYPDALRNVITSAGTVTQALSQTTADFHQSLDLVNEYASAFAAGGKQLVPLLQQFALIGARLTSKSADIVELFTLLSELARIADRVVSYYGRELAPVFDGIDDIFDTLFSHPERIGKAAEGLGQIINIVVPMLSGNGVIVNEGNRLIPGQDLCVPSVLKQC